MAVHHIVEWHHEFHTELNYINNYLKHQSSPIHYFFSLSYFSMICCTVPPQVEKH